MPALRKLFFLLMATALAATACGGSGSEATASGDTLAATDDGGDAVPPSNAGSESDPVEDETVADEEPVDDATAGEENTDVFDIGLGDCFNDQGLAAADEDAAEITDVGAIPCDQAHQFEVYHVFDMLNETFPGEEETINLSETGCFDAFEPFVGIAYAESIYGLSYLYPTADSWDQGDREVLCVISMYDGTPKTGTARATAQ